MNHIARDLCKAPDESIISQPTASACTHTSQKRLAVRVCLNVCVCVCVHVGGASMSQTETGGDEKISLLH